MQISEDYFLIRVAAIIVPAFALLIGSMIISLLVIKRYSRAVKRLYQMNFHGVETERKGIANDMHDEIGYTIMQVNNSLQEASKKTLDNQAIEQINLAQHLIGDLHLSLRQLIENVYPRELMVTNWKDSFEQLAQGMSIGNRHINVDIEVDSELNTKQLHQMFRLTQEMLANAFTHSKAESVSLQIYQESECLKMNFTYKSSRFFLPKIKSHTGRGSFIIAERLRLLDAKSSNYYQDGYIHEIISFPIQK
jgi:glucose-6-phosphate-specific signal transduction histidine kinase